jgi:thiol-disulfide isomerase/thioredoxin
MAPEARRWWSRIDFRLVTAVVFVLAVGGFAASRLPGLRSPVLKSAVSAQANKEESLPAPDFQGITAWINSPPLSIGSLKGDVILVDFWTYSCVNCIRTLPFLKAFYATYHPFGLQIVGVHSPEFSFEKVESNVRAAVSEHGVVWPVAMDNDRSTWDAYRNQYWPHVYLVDRTGAHPLRLHRRGLRRADPDVDQEAPR